MSLELADDGKPKVDVVALARSVGQNGLHTLTPRDVRAMAAALVDFDAALQFGVRTVVDIASLSEEPLSTSRRSSISSNLFKFAHRLAATGHLGGADVEKVFS